MSQVKDQLMDLYSQGPLEQVHASRAYQQLCRDHMGDRAFHGERELMEELRQYVDDYLAPRNSYREQVEFALRLVRNLDTAQKKETCRALILRSYGGQWATAQRQYFEQYSHRMMEAVDYFLSFTNRNLNKPKLNEVNRNHRHFIIDSLGRREYERADLSARNLVAEAVHYHLRNCQFRGFYYPDHEGDNTVVKDKLSRNCLGSLAFVQLVQAAIFRFETQSPNWCFFEYELVRKQDLARILFVRLEDNIPSDNLHPTFGNWFQAFATGDPVLLVATRWHKPDRIDANRQSIREKLADQIRQAVNRIYSQIPD